MLSLLPYTGENSFSGKIPTQIGKMKRLQTLDLCKYCPFIILYTYMFPFLTMADNISTFELYNYTGRNLLTGAIPTELGNLENLKDLYLGKYRIVLSFGIIVFVLNC